MEVDGEQCLIICVFLLLIPIYFALLHLRAAGRVILLWRTNTGTQLSRSFLIHSSRCLPKTCVSGRQILIQALPNNIHSLDRHRLDLRKEPGGKPKNSDWDAFRSFQKKWGVKPCHKPAMTKHMVNIAAIKNADDWWMSATAPGIILIDQCPSMRRPAQPLRETPSGIPY